MCPQCNKQVAELYETRKADGEVFYKNYSGKKYNFITNKEKKNIDYTLLAINKKQRKNIYGWVYGVNIETKNKDNESVIKTYKKDFYGNKELIMQMTQ